MQLLVCHFICHIQKHTHRHIYECTQGTDEKKDTNKEYEVKYIQDDISLLSYDFILFHILNRLFLSACKHSTSKELKFNLQCTVGITIQIKKIYFSRCVRFSFFCVFFFCLIAFSMACIWMFTKENVCVIVRQLAVSLEKHSN